MEIQSYRDLKVGQRAMDVAALSYALTKNFPAAERYGLTAQIRRAAASVAANIAEGYGRESTGAYVNFLRIAQGSVKELETHLLLASASMSLSRRISMTYSRGATRSGACFDPSFVQ